MSSYVGVVSLKLISFWFQSLFLFVRHKLVDEEIEVPINTAKPDVDDNIAEPKDHQLKSVTENNQKDEAQAFNWEVTFNKKRNRQQNIDRPIEELNNQKEESMFDQKLNDQEDKFEHKQPADSSTEFNPFSKNNNFYSGYQEQHSTLMKKFSRDYNKFQRQAEEGEVTGKFGGSQPYMFGEKHAFPQFAKQQDMEEDLPRQFNMERHRWTSAEWDMANRQRNTKDTNQPSFNNQFNTRGAENDNSIHENLFEAKESKIYSQDLSMEYYNKGIINDFYADKRFSTDSDPHYNIFTKAMDTNLDNSDIHNSEFKKHHMNIADRINNSQIEHNPFKNQEMKKTSKKLAFSELKPSSYRPFEEELKFGNTTNNLYDETVSTLGLDYTLLDPNEPLIMDNGIMKFHPGFSINYVSRWIQVTRTVIRFYKNYYHSVCSFRRPLAVIPIGAVGSVESIKINSKFSKGTKAFHYGKNPFDQNQFEIVLKEDYEAIYDLNKRKREIEELKYELELIQKLDEQTHLQNKYKKYRKQWRMSKSPIPTFKYFIDRQSTSKKSSRSNPRMATYSRLYEDEMSRIDMKTNRSHEPFE